MPYRSSINTIGYHTVRPDAQVRPATRSASPPTPTHAPAVRPDGRPSACTPSCRRDVPADLTCLTTL